MINHTSDTLGYPWVRYQTRFLMCAAQMRMKTYRSLKSNEILRGFDADVFTDIYIGYLRKKQLIENYYYYFIFLSVISKNRHGVFQCSNIRSIQCIGQKNLEHIKLAILTCSLADKRRHFCDYRKVF